MDATNALVWWSLVGLATTASAGASKCSKVKRFGEMLSSLIQQPLESAARCKTKMYDENVTGRPEQATS